MQPLSAARCVQDKERPGKAEDVVRLYDALVGYASELGELAADLGGAAGESLIDEAAAQVLRCPTLPPLGAEGHRFTELSALPLSVEPAVSLLKAELSLSDTSVRGLVRVRSLLTQLLLHSVLWCGLSEHAALLTGPGRPRPLSCMA